MCGLWCCVQLHCVCGCVVVGECVAHTVVCVRVVCVGLMCCACVDGCVCWPVLSVGCVGVWPLAVRVVVVVVVVGVGVVVGVVVVGLVYECLLLMWWSMAICGWLLHQRFFIMVVRLVIV